jgi:hypothetical protein
MTGMVRALVIQDEYSGEIWLYTLPDKGQNSVLGALKSFSRMAQTQWNLKICRIRRDNEKALGNQYDDWVTDEGIHDEPTPVYTPAENPRAERSGGVVRAKALAMQLGARFPTELWHEIWQAAVYLHNRSPREANAWKSPIEVRNKWLRQSGRDVPEVQDPPDLSNLWAYGCRAYPLRERVRAGKDAVENRTKPRTHIGYLVGYEGSNLYRIWVPSEATVLRTRDVDFVEDEFFDPEKEERPDQELISFHMDAESAPEPIPTREADDESESEAESTVFVRFPDESDDDSDGEVEEGKDISAESQAKDYPTPESIPEGSESSSHDVIVHTSRSRTPSPEPPDDSQERSSDEAQNGQEPSSHEAPNSLTETGRTTRARNLSEKALENLRQSGSVYKSGNAVSFPMTVLACFSIGMTHRLHRRNLPPEPRTWQELLKHPYKKEFLEAASIEWEAVQKMGTIRKIKREMARSKPIPLIWIFKYKFDDHGFLTKFKARICVRGDLQPVNEKETYAATLAARSFRILMALAARWKLKARQLDAINAFPNSDLDEEVYVELPPGFKESGVVALLLKALYGLRRSPYLWQKLLSTVLSDLGLCCVPEEPCLFVNNWLIVFFYVDDIVYMYREQHEAQAELFREALTNRFKMRDLGDLQWFLGIQVMRDWENQQIWLSQESYIEEIARRFQLADLNGSPATPISSKPVPNDDLADYATIHLYQRKVGSLNYAAVITRPETSKSCSELASFLNNPSKAHMAEANRCVQYLYGTRKMGILFDGKRTYDREFEVFTDASFADDSNTRRSSQGWLMILYGGPVAWNASKQATVTTSSTEAELLGLSFAAKEVIATMRLFAGLRFHLDENLIIWCDNKQTIRLVAQELQRLRTALRHVDVHQCWVRQEVQRGTFAVEYIETSKMAADGMTKILNRAKFQTFVKQLGLVRIPEAPVLT